MKLIWATSIFALAVIGIADAANSQELEVGKYEYLNSCASCHGPGGKGDGPVAKALRRMPADLTKLSEANKGVFPFSVLTKSSTADLKSRPMANGTCRCGARFTSRRGVLGNPEFRRTYLKSWLNSIVRVRILALIEYISTLQGK